MTAPVIAANQIAVVLHRHFGGFLAHDPHDPEAFWNHAVDAVLPLIGAFTARAWDEGYNAGHTMARMYGHVDYWEDEPENPYVRTASQAAPPAAPPEAECAEGAAALSSTLWSGGRSRAWSGHIADCAACRAASQIPAAPPEEGT